MKPSKPLTVLFDANPIAIAGRSGVGHYSAYLVQALAEAYPEELKLVGHYYDFLGRKHPVLPVAPNIIYRPTKLFPGRVPNMLRRLGLSIPFEWLAKQRGDVLLFPNFLTQPSSGHRPVVVTIHDLCFVVHPEFVNGLNLHDLRRYVPQSLKRARLVLTVSEFTKASLTETFGVAPERIAVTPVPPLENTMLPETEAEGLVTKAGITKPYILFVGNLEPRKNLLGLVEAYAACNPEIRERYSLVLAGGKGWKNEDLLARVTELQGAGLDIILPGYISDELKAALYQRASLVVLPSFYEGFGMPVLEAFQYGVPVAASDIPVLHEVAANAAVYFNPADAADMAAAMDRALQDEALRRQLVQDGTARLQRYSWQQNAKQVFTKFQELCK